MEEKLAVRLVQLGIRTINTHQKEQIKRFGVETIEMKNWNPETPLNLESPVYLSLDMDGLDPAFAPGVSHIEPGGFSSREILRIIQNLDIELVGADIVELNPKCDINGITAMASAKFLKEIIAKMLNRYE
jgi:arginase family enzyme